MELEFDLIVAGGKVIFPEAEKVANLGVVNGRIVEVSERPLSGRSEIDASGHVILPGLVDPHVHFYVPTDDPGFLSWSDTYQSGAQAAAAGGVTSVLAMVVQVRGRPAFAEIERHTSAARESLVDFGFHAGLTDPSPETLDEIPRLIAAGVTSFKFYLTYRQWEIRVGLGFLFAAMSVIADHGGVAAIHCEHDEVVTWLRNSLIARGQAGDLALHAASRPSWAEEIAIRDAVVVAREAGCPFYPVHVSSAKGLAAVREGKGSLGNQMSAETAIHYLCADSRAMSGELGALYLTTPPLRGPADVEALWSGVMDGTVDWVASDHGPHPASEKLAAPSFDYAPDGSEYACPPGFAGTELILPLMHEMGVRRRGMSFSRLAQVTSTNAARKLNLRGKGQIAPGMDADLVLFDPSFTKTIEQEALHGASDHTIFEGITVTGWPAATIRRGEILVEQGRLNSAASPGRFIERRPHAPAAREMPHEEPA